MLGGVCDGWLVLGGCWDGGGELLLGEMLLFTLVGGLVGCAFVGEVPGLGCAPDGWLVLTGGVLLVGERLPFLFVDGLLGFGVVLVPG